MIDIAEHEKVGSDSWGGGGGWGGESLKRRMTFLLHYLRFMWQS